MPWAAAVQPPSVQLMPARIPSTPIRHPSRIGRDASQRSPRPWLDHTPPGSEANELETSALTVGDAKCSVGENDPELKVVPPVSRTVPTPTPNDARACAPSGRTPRRAAHRKRKSRHAGSPGAEHAGSAHQPWFAPSGTRGHWESWASGLTTGLVTQGLWRAR